MKERLIVALDFPSLSEAEAMIKTLGDAVCYYKVGLELFLNTRGKILDILEKENKQIFLDLKFHDIPNTSAAAARFAASLPMVGMFNIHASGGAKMMAESAAAKGAGQKLIAVTVLTSLDESDIKANFQSNLSPKELAVRLALLSKQAGCDGVVCSPREAAAIKEACGQNFITVCPGIRFADSSAGDQKRTLGPGDAVRGGADYLVMGRPITADKDPKAAALRALGEMA